MYSRRLLLVINERTKLILLYPEMGRIDNFVDHRRIALEHYSLFYRKVDDKIIITAFWDNNQRTKRLLKVLREK